MNSTYLPSSVQSTLFSFRPYFTAPSFENFVALVCGWILCQGSHTISRVLVAAVSHGLAPKGHSAYYRFLSRARWSVDAAGHVLFGLLLPFLPQEIEAAVDDTLCHRTGPHLFGAGMHHDAATSTYGGSGGRRASFAFGHNWVVLSLWVPLPWNRERGLAVPVLFRLYRSKKRCSKAQYRKRTELAREMLELLCSWLPEDRSLDLAGDGEYACKTLVRVLPRGVVFTGPMSMNAALYAPVLKRTRGRGRPRVKGRRLRSPAQRAKRQEKWVEHTIGLYGREVSILIQTWTCLWYTVSGPRLVRVVLTRDPKGRWKDRAYFCTDPERSVEAVLQRYAHRWQLEVAFQSAKQNLGLEDPRNGWWRRVHGRRADTTKAGPKPRGNCGRKAVERTAPLIFLAYGIVAIWFFRHGNVDRVVARQRKSKPWYGLKREPAYIDMLAALRREFWGACISRHPSLRPHRAKIIGLIESFAGVA
jgi:hypothetical protein